MNAVRNCLVFACSFVTFLVVISIIPFVKFFLKISRFKFISVWTGRPIINLAVNAKAEKKLGVKTISIVRHAYYITNSFDVNLRKIFPNKFAAFFIDFIAFLGICLLASRVHVYCDGGILPNYRRSFFNKFELLAYKFLKIPTFAWTYGADVRTISRTTALGYPNCCTDCVEPLVACVCDDKLGEENYKFVKKNTTAIFSMGDMMEYTPDSDNSMFFWPVDLERDNGKFYEPAYPRLTNSAPLKIVHAPNHRNFKGTSYLIDAVKRLRDDGHNIDLILVEKLPNNIAMDIYRSADLVFDQCMGGFHGYFALEAMALGKPLMCYIKKPEVYLINSNLSPIININVNNIDRILIDYLYKKRGSLNEIGIKSRRYVEQNFSIDAFVGRLKLAYTKYGVAL